MWVRDFIGKPTDVERGRSRLPQRFSRRLRTSVADYFAVNCDLTRRLTGKAPYHGSTDVEYRNRVVIADSISTSMGRLHSGHASGSKSEKPSTKSRMNLSPRCNVEPSFIWQQGCKRSNPWRSPSNHKVLEVNSSPLQRRD